MTMGAQFHRGDLHIHSFGDGGSYDVIDNQMTPENIIAKAIEEKLSILSITDHNKISNSISAVSLSKSTGILVIPGVEISTTQGHLLAYFKTSDELENFYGKLTFTSDKKFCNQGIYDCLELVRKYNGIGILAHIEVESGFEKTIGKFNEIFDQAFQHPAIFALEIKNHDSINHYTENDSVIDRKNAIKKRNIKLELPENYRLAKIMSSDAHSMNAFGKNAAGTDRLTRFKLDELSFDSLKIALLSNESRVRLEDDIPEALPRFKSIKTTGGILDGIHIELSNNMNCIIGGRGTGKSTLLTALQEASNNPVESTNIQKSSAWPTKIELCYENEACQEFNFTLEYKNLTCLNQLGEIVDIEVPIEAYSQGFTSFSNTLSDDEKDNKLLGFFDGFTNVEHLKREDRSKIIQLQTNFENLEKLNHEVTQRSDVEKELATLLSKQAAYEQQKVGELMKLHSALIVEENLRKELESALLNLKNKYQKVLLEKDEINNLLAIDKAKVHVGSEHIDKVLQIVKDFSSIVDRHQEELSKELTEKLSLLRSEVTNWRDKEKQVRDKILETKKQLDENNIPYDETKYVKLSSDIARLLQRQKEIDQANIKLTEVKRERGVLFKDRVRISSDIHKNRLSFCTRVNRDLSGSIGGLFVNAKIGERYISKEFSTYLKSEMGWHRWSSSEKISNAISPLDFYINMKKQKYDFLKVLEFSQDEIDDITNTIKELTLEKIISIPFKERPRLTVTRHNKSDSNADVKDISELSLGQQQSIMLSILIQSDSTLPLIIDQPEDNLDSEFIFNSIVSNLRKCKEKRQIIIVTHNSNIGVLGDAELVIPLIASNDKSSTVGVGSIDNHVTQEKCCEILEGGKLAFKTRKDIYGI